MNATEFKADAEEWADWLENHSRQCLSWVDLRATNQHVKAVIASRMHLAISTGLFPSESESASGIATWNGKHLNWHGLRLVTGIHRDHWTAEFDPDSAPPHKRRVFKPISISGDDTEAGKEQSEWTSKSDGRTWVKSDATHVTADRTPDELREWYKRQSLAWAQMLRTVSSMILVSESDDEKALGGANGAGVSTEHRGVEKRHDPTPKTTRKKKTPRRSMNAAAADCARRYKADKGRTPLKHVIAEYVDEQGGSITSIHRVLNDNPDQWKTTQKDDT
ncbi:hypothetical protein K227x_05920 [Rubripirellula lacrimiformis]|uniref:Uncharacterized protein n=1 Tax=Rubripirellula lacrimiformis TaxID=1930273 RepID=A0A517N504_9BACT|nr:hypothetical protein [Rubripirellula lacrimiformis]QDT02220.1 hypothetical protein K227x_05920 [Rubripirellula lacrimiformis]